jgi:hypothetical protein
MEWNIITQRDVDAALEREVSAGAQETNAERTVASPVEQEAGTPSAPPDVPARPGAHPSPPQALQPQTTSGTGS